MANAEFRSSDGKLIVRAAREAVTSYLCTGRYSLPHILLLDDRFEAKRGCFVTLKKNDDERTLRGCIGFPDPLFKLSKAIPDAAVAAATRDPRFPPVTSVDEFNHLLAEVSILTAPELITVNSPKELPERIVVGRDGLILRWPLGAGLLLPQVAREYGWNTEEFLCNVAMKAGAPPDQWLLRGTEVLKFQSIVFEEESPLGPVRFKA